MFKDSNYLPVLDSVVVSTPEQCFEQQGCSLKYMLSNIISSKLSDASISFNNSICTTRNSLCRGGQPQLHCVISSKLAFSLNNILAK